MSSSDPTSVELLADVAAVGPHQLRAYLRDEVARRKLAERFAAPPVRPELSRQPAPR